MLGQAPDQDQGVSRLKSFSGPGAADELSSKAAKKKSKREPSPLSRMGSSLLRPFKGLSKLRTSRSSDKDSKLQGLSRAASHTESLASRATSTSTQDAAGPSRFNSASLQNPKLQGGHSALEPSDSFQFRRTGTEDAPDLAAEPSFAQDLPQNSRSVQAGSTSRAQAPLLSSGRALLTASAGSGRLAWSARPCTQPSSLSSNDLQQKASAAAADAAAESDDEFDYDFSQPAAPQHSMPTTALLQPKVMSTSSLQAESTTGRAGGTGSGLQAQGNTDSSKGEGSLTHTASTASQQKPSGFSIEPGKFRPQRSRADKPQLAVVAASVYSPLESGAATSPTMRGGTREGNSRDEAPETGDQAELVLQEEQPLAAGGQKASNDQQDVLQHGDDEDKKGSQAQASAAKGTQPQAGGLPRQQNSKDAQGSTDKQDGPAAKASGSHQGSLRGALTRQGFLDEGDDSSSPSVSTASSAASSEFDILEALPNQSSQLQPPLSASLPASPLQPQAEPYTVQRSAYSDTPILGPSTSKYGQAGSSASAASADGQGSGAMLSHRGLPRDGAQQAQSQASALPLSLSSGPLTAADALPATPRRGFSDKPILAVYSRRPSADEEATQAKDSGSQTPPSDPVLQTKVGTARDCSTQFANNTLWQASVQQASELPSQGSCCALNVGSCLPAMHRIIALLQMHVNRAIVMEQTSMC